MAHKNANLHEAKKAKKDEFYTQLSDIENELRHYRHHFQDKVVFLNCDDPEESNFWKYFELNFDYLGLKKLIATHFEREKQSYKLEMVRGQDLNGDGKMDHHDIVRTTLEANGDFRSPECIELLKEADIVCTNPPFSLFREYIATLMKYEKKFIIIGNQNAIAYKEVFPLIKENKVWLGYGFKGNVAFFRSPYEDTAKSSQHKEGLIRVSGVVWFTNLDIKKRHEELLLYKEYSAKDYPTYDNYDAIEVKQTADIPCDYAGIMGVPITFMDKYNPDQFEIVGLSSKHHCGDVQRLHDNDYYNGYTRGKVVTRVESNMPLLATSAFGGTKCVKDGCPDIYQIYWRIFIILRAENPDALASGMNAASSV